MVYTEEEAKKHICPYGRNITYYDKDCLASKCMAWRWITTLAELELNPKEGRQGTCNIINPKQM